MPILRPARFLSWHLDFLGFSASFLCAIHCLALPLLLSMGLLGGLTWLHHPLVEWSLIGGAVLIAGPAFYRGYRGHQRSLPAGMASLGFLLLALSRWSHENEHLLTGVGGILIAVAHWYNWQYGRCPVQETQEMDSKKLDNGSTKKPVNIAKVSAVLLLLIYLFGIESTCVHQNNRVLDRSAILEIAWKRTDLPHSAKSSERTDRRED